MPTTEISPPPTAEEAAAIAAAVEALWPKPVEFGHQTPRGSLAWRFSGRWWHRDRHGAAERPWN